MRERVRENAKERATAVCVYVREGERMRKVCVGGWMGGERERECVYV